MTNDFKGERPEGKGEGLCRRSFLAIAPAGVAAGIAASTPGRAFARTHKAPVHLRFSHFLGPDSYFQTDLIEPWARELEALLPGEVTVEILSGKDPTGDVTKQAAQVESGIVDIALGLRGAEGQRMALSSLIELPMLVDDARTGSRALWRLFEAGHLASDYRGLKPLALFVHNPGVVHTLGRRVAAPADMAGLRLRVPGGPVALAATRLGAVPTILQVNDVMPAIHKGALDGVITNWGTPLTGFYDTLKCHCDVPFYASAFFIAMNPARYAALPPRVRHALDQLSGVALVERMVALWNRWDGAGRSRANAPGHEVVEPDTAQRAAWREALAPVADAYLAELEPAHPEVRTVHATMLRLIADA